MDRGNSRYITFSPGFNSLVLIIAGLNGLIGIKRIAESFSTTNIYEKDFIQEYLMAKAILADVNPYLPLPHLAAILMGENNYKYLNHPTPHPPFMGLVSLPLGSLDYKTATIVWLILQLLCLLASLMLLLRWWDRSITARWILILFVLMLGWPPITKDLWLGQINSSLLLLTVGAWLALRSDKNILGGAMLGGLVALKLTAWPIVIFLGLRRIWSGVISAGAVVLIANLLATATIGYDCVKDYYLKVSPLVASIYRVQDINFSLWTVGERLFSGIGFNVWSPPLWSPPLWDSPTLARACTFVVPVVFLLYGLWLASKAQDRDVAFGLLIGGGILVSPIVWSHNMILALISSIPSFI